MNFNSKERISAIQKLYHDNVVIKIPNIMGKIHPCYIAEYDNKKIFSGFLRKFALCTMKMSAKF